MEEWRVIEQAPDYLISSRGRIRNRHTGKDIKSSNSRVYPTVNLKIDGKYYQKNIHRLVAMAFVEGGRPDLLVNHIDGDKHNYLPENLKWVTREENVEHARRGGFGRKLRTWIVVDGELVERERD